MNLKISCMTYFVVFLLFRALTIILVIAGWSVVHWSTSLQRRLKWSQSVRPFHWMPIYVRDVKSAAVRAICGSTYMLIQYEELWAKELRLGVEELFGWREGPLTNTFVNGPLNGKIVYSGFSANTKQLNCSLCSERRWRLSALEVPHNAALYILMISIGNRMDVHAIKE